MFTRTVYCSRLPSTKIRNVINSVNLESKVWSKKAELAFVSVNNQNSCAGDKCKSQEIKWHIKIAAVTVIPTFRWHVFMRVEFKKIGKCNKGQKKRRKAPISSNPNPRKKKKTRRRRFSVAHKFQLQFSSSVTQFF